MNDIRKYTPSLRDPALESDKVFCYILLSESKYEIMHSNFLKLIQKDIMPHHRKIVTDWMLEVCEEQNCASNTFLSAVQYLDRFLAILEVKRSQLQLIASACLLLSSKFHDTFPITSLNLIIYTDCSISKTELQAAEILILEKIRWELGAPNSGQILHFILSRIEMFLVNQVIKVVENHSVKLLNLIETEYIFSSLHPSVKVSSV